MDETASDTGDEKGVWNAELDGVVDSLLGLGKHGVELGGLRNGTGETVKDETGVRTVESKAQLELLYAPPLALRVLLELLLDHADHDLVTDETTLVHDLLGGLAQLSLAGNLRTKHVSGSKVADAVLLSDLGSLGALSCWLMCAL